MSKPRCAQRPTPLHQHLYCTQVQLSSSLRLCEWSGLLGQAQEGGGGATHGGHGAPSRQLGCHQTDGQPWRHASLLRWGGMGSDIWPWLACWLTRSVGDVEGGEGGPGDGADVPEVGLQLLPRPLHCGGTRGQQISRRSRDHHAQRRKVAPGGVAASLSVALIARHQAASASVRRSITKTVLRCTCMHGPHTHGW
jgi:hypothetical protein